MEKKVSGRFLILKMAIGKLKEALMIAEKLGGSLLIIDTLGHLCSAYLEMDDFETATTILKELEQSEHLNTKNESIMGIYNYVKACLLSTSTRTRDLGKAQDILKLLLNNFHIERNIQHQQTFL